MENLKTNLNVTMLTLTALIKASLEDSYLQEENCPPKKNSRITSFSKFPPKKQHISDKAL